MYRHVNALRVLAVASVIAVTSATGAAVGAIASPARAVAADVTITITAGGDRTADTTVAGLAGERFAVVAGTQGTTPPDGATPTASCVTGGSGTCAVAVPPRSGGSGNGTAGYWIRQSSVPSGWFASPVLDVGKSGTEIGLDYAWLFVADVRNNVRVPIADTGSGSTPTARGSLWAASRDNPPLPDKCGLNVALDFDLSGSIGSNITNLRDAGKSFVQALTGTPSSVAVYTFATHAPASKPGNSNLPLTSVATQGSADTVLSKINGLSVETGNEAGTNWDQGIWQVASSSNRYDVTLVLTDGNPTFYGPKAAGPGSSTRFIEVENGIFSANALKAKSTNVISVGIGTNLGRSVSNLAAISGPVPNRDYFVTNFASLGDLLTSLALKNCLGTVNVVKEVVPSTNAPGDVSGAEPAPGWTFHASPDSVQPTTGVTGDDGAISFSTATKGMQPVTLTEDLEPDYHLFPAADGDHATCRNSEGDTVPVTNAGSAGFIVKAVATKVITCVVYNQKELAPSPASVLVTKEWVINGVTYDYPNQPPDFQSSLTLDPIHPDGTPAEWGQQYDGYLQNDEVTIGEKDVHAPPGCTVEEGGDLGQNGPLDAGLNTFTVVNRASCQTQLTLVKRIANPFPGVPTVPIDSWTLTATAPDGTETVQGTSGVTGYVQPGTSYVLSESDVPGYVQVKQPGSDLREGATGSWDCITQTARHRPGLENFIGGDGTVTVPVGEHVVCTAVNVPKPARLTLVKYLIKHSGDAEPGDWTLTAAPVSGRGPTHSGATGSHEVTNQLIPPGVEYQLSEQGGPPDYTLDSLSCVLTGTSTPVPLTDDEFTADIDQDITCTFVNKQEPGPTPSPTPTRTPHPTPSPTGSVPPGPLPVTGANLLALLSIASSLLLAGAGAVFLARLRRRRSF